MLGGIIAWEAHDPELVVVHFLTVASYNLQHPAQFVENVIPQLEASFVGYLSGTITLDQIRSQTRKAFNGPQRVLKPLDQRRPVARQWPITIADVYLVDQPEGAAERVRAWAESIRQELTKTSAGTQKTAIKAKTSRSNR